MFNKKMQKQIELRPVPDGSWAGIKNNLEQRLLVLQMWNRCGGSEREPVLASLGTEEKSVGEVAQGTSLIFMTVSTRLRTYSRARIVEQRPYGRVTYNRVDLETLARVKELAPTLATMDLNRLAVLNGQHCWNVFRWLYSEMSENPRDIRNKDIAEGLGMIESNVSAALTRLTMNDLLVREGRSLYVAQLGADLLKKLAWPIYYI